MNAIVASWQRVLGRGRPQTRSLPAADPVIPAPPRIEMPPVEIAPNDPLLAYCQSASGAVDLDRLELDSPACRALRAAGVKLVVPLVSQGELIGSLNLGRRLSEQDYSTDDRKLLENLAAQAAPAVRVAQLVREQEAQARARLTCASSTDRAGAPRGGQALRGPWIRRRTSRVRRRRPGSRSRRARSSATMAWIASADMRALLGRVVAQHAELGPAAPAPMPSMARPRVRWSSMSMRWARGTVWCIARTHARAEL